MSLESQAAYTYWRFMVYCHAKKLTYNDIDKAVSQGTINPSMSPHEVCVALKLPPRICEHVFVDDHCTRCGYPGV